MMRPTYPLTCALIEHLEAESTVIQRRAASGRIRTYDLGAFSDHPVRLTHVLIDRAAVDEVLAFWRANRNRPFNVQTSMGDHWVGAFTRRPAPTHIEGPWYDLVVEVIRYDPAEGGL